MSFLGQLREKAHARYIAKKLKDHHAKHDTVSFAQAERIGILFDGSDIENYGVVRNYAEEYKRKGKKVKLLGYINTSNPNASLSFQSFSKKNLNWMLKPNSVEVESFMKQNFDILINAYLQPIIPLLYISTFSNAKLRVGLYYPERTMVSDMMITVNGDANLDSFFKEIEHYLNIFHHHD